MRVQWSTISGQTYVGIITEVDSNVLYVMCDDGKERCVEDCAVIILDEEVEEEATGDSQSNKEPPLG